MQYLGDYKEDETVYFMWSTNDADGASVTRTADGTVSVYKDNGVTQSVVGVTDTEDFDGLTGIHACTIDLSADAFYATGADYAVVLSAATIDGQTVNAVLAHFSIENRFQEVDVVKWLGTAPLALSSQRVQTYVAAMASDVVSAAAFAQAAADKVWGTAARALTDKAGFSLSTAGIQAIWDKATSGLTTAGSIGKLLVDNINATIASRSSHAAADIWAVATRTLSTAGTQAIWDKLTSALTTAGSIGKLLVDNINATISSRSSHGDPTSAIKGSPGKTLQEAYDNERGTDNAALATALATAQADLDNPDQYKADVSALATAVALATHDTDIKALINALNDLADSEVWNYATRTLTDPSSYKADVSSLALEATIADLITRAKGLDEIYDAVILRALEATLTTMKETTAGTFDRDTESLQAIRDRGDVAWITGGGGAAPTVEEIADGVWNELKAGHSVAGSFGVLLALEATLTAIKGDDWSVETLVYIKELIDTVKKGDFQI